MKITSINSTLYTNKQNNTKAFKGLWSETSFKNDKDPVMCIFKPIETSYYHPFSDESQENCDKIKKENSSAKIVKVNGQSQYQINECKICSRLPFTQAQYEEYKKASINDELTNELIDVHRHLLDKFENKNLNNQRPAVNTIITKKIEEALGKF